MQLSFLTPRVERLSVDGTFEVLHPGSALGRLRPTVVLLARELCAFSLFEAAALPRARRLQAARLHARVGSPYLVGAAALSRVGQDYGIWWWDVDRITAAMLARFGAGRPVVRPESLAQPRGQGWRIVREAGGYEAQYWRDGAIAASTWRRSGYDAASWAGFARQVRHASDPGNTPPAPVQLPLAADSEALSLNSIELTREQWIALGVGTIATALAGLTLFTLGQGLALREDAREIETEVAQLRAATPQATATTGLQSDRQRLAAYRQAEERTNAITATGAAVGITSIYDLTPEAVEVDEGVLTLTLPYAALARSAELIAEFEGSGYFHDVRPRTDGAGQNLIMEMRIREAAPPLNIDG